MPKGGATGLRCSFCGKGQKDCDRLIAGPGVYICDQCVELCEDIMAEEGQGPKAPRPTPSFDRYRLALARAGGAETRLDFPLPLGTIGIRLQVSGSTWTGPCPDCGAWTLEAADRHACFHCERPLPGPDGPDKPRDGDGPSP